jgi:hypothetical protein
MENEPGQFERWVMVTEAAKIAERSTDAIRRAIKAGKITTKPRASKMDILYVSYSSLIEWVDGPSKPLTSSSDVSALEAQLAEAITRAEKAENDAANLRQLAEAERARADAERGRADAEAKRAETLVAVLALNSANPNRQPRWRWRKSANPSPEAP